MATKTIWASIPCGTWLLVRFPPLLDHWKYRLTTPSALVWHRSSERPAPLFKPSLSLGTNGLPNSKHNLSLIILSSPVVRTGLAGNHSLGPSVRRAGGVPAPCVPGALRPSQAGRSSDWTWSQSSLELPHMTRCCCLVFTLFTSHMVTLHKTPFPCTPPASQLCL